jgi:hypothetical protein
MTEQKVYRDLHNVESPYDDPRNRGDIKVTSISVGEKGSEVAITATPAELNAVVHGATATAAEINAVADRSAITGTMAPSAAVLAAATTAINYTTVRLGNVVETTIVVDLTGLKGTTTDHDIIGDTGASHIGQVTTAVNGAIFAGEVHCAVVPTVGPDDIDLATATVATGAYDADVTAVTGYAAIMTSGGAHAIGTIKPFTALPAANSYLYLASGEGGTAGTYGAGKLIIKMWGLLTT